ncbi:1-acyl-sn-glycerol-3-phosphate acyltransferase [candidate division KSB1 bacterium]|nr:1-acyl-sn-glycerol-3-phosphate acyltransferase [candidate division KSB1 bacterium]
MESTAPLPPIRFSAPLYHIWQRNTRLLLCISRLRIDGLQHLPSTGPAILAPNHLNWKDIFVIAGSIQRPIAFAATDHLFYVDRCLEMLNRYFTRSYSSGLACRVCRRFNPYLAYFMVSRVRSSGSFSVRHERQPFALVDGCKKALLQGKLVCIFPEGRIGQNGRLRRFKLGLAKSVYDVFMYNDISVPVFPAAIAGTASSICPGRRLSFVIGAPLTIDAFVGAGERQSLIDLTREIRGRVQRLVQSEGAVWANK